MALDAPSDIRKIGKGYFIERYIENCIAPLQLWVLRLTKSIRRSCSWRFLERVVELIRLRSGFSFHLCCPLGITVTGERHRLSGLLTLDPN